MTAASTIDRRRPRSPDAAHPAAAHRRVPALDGLRGVAVVGVVLYHAGHLQGGFLGVDLFFVLSGYLITTILLRSYRHGGQVDLKRFWSRRARRLLPALLVMLVVVVPVYSRWFATPAELTSVRRDGFASLLYVTNWGQILSGQTYWAATLAESPLKHAWSLAVEEQFYLLWPLVLVVAARRHGARAVLWLAGGLAAFLALGTVVLAATNAVSYNSLYLGTHARAAALLAGAALAAWYRLYGPPRSIVGTRRLESAAMTAVVVLGFMWVTLSVTDRSLYVGGLALSAIAGTVIVASCAAPGKGPLTTALAWAPLRFLGTISYGIYLWSWPINQMISARHTDFRGWTLFAVQVSVTMVAALLSWVLVEKPILNGALRPPASGLAVAIGAVVAFVAIFAATVGAVPEVPTTGSTAGYVTATAADAPKLMVVGDSVPNRITEEGIVPLRNELGVSVVDRSAPGCILIADVGPVKGIEGDIRSEVGPCDIGWRAAVQTLRPDIVLVMLGQFPNDQVEIDGTFYFPCTPEYDQLERAHLDKAVDDLSSTGAKVVFATMPGSTVSWVIDKFPAGMNDRVACMNRIYTDVANAHPNSSIVDFAPYICPPGQDCKNTIDGVNLREDTIHFRGPSAELVARWLIPRVLGQVGSTADPTLETTTTPSPTATTASGSGAGGGGSGDPTGFCGTVRSLQGSFGPVLAAPAPGAEVTREQILVLVSRPFPAELLPSAPLELRGDVADLAERWPTLAVNAEKLPERPSDKDLVAFASPITTQAAHLTSWVQANC